MSLPLRQRSILTLDGTNYEEWLFSIKAILRGKKVLEVCSKSAIDSSASAFARLVIDGRLKSSDNPDDSVPKAIIEQFVADQKSEAWSIIVTSIESTQLFLINNLPDEDPCKAMALLERHFASNSSTHKLQLLMTLFSTIRS